MTSYIGNNTTSKFFLGNSPISKIYKGLEQVYSLVVPVELDPPITSTLATETYHTFGFDRLVEGYTGNTVKLIKLSDNGESDFGFDSQTGKFDIDTVNTWREGADVDVVKFYDQKGTAIELFAGGTVSFIRSDVVKRMGTDYQFNTGLLAQSTSVGSVCCDFGVDTGYLYTTSTIANPSVNGMEIHTLVQYNERKTASNYISEFGNGANSDVDYLLSYGVGTSQYYRVQIGGGTNQSILTRLYTGTTNGVNNSDVLGKYCVRQHAPLIWSHVMDNAYFGILGNGTEIRTKSVATNLSNGILDNGKLLVGNFFSTTTGGARTTNLGNLNFSGIVLTKRITDIQRFSIQSKLNAVGQQHLIKSKTDIENYFDEIHIMSDVDTNGLVAGRKGLFDLQFNKTIGTPNWNFDYTLPNSGLKGIRAIGDTVADNYFQATTTEFNDWTEFTVLAIHELDPATTVTDNVTASVGQSSAAPNTTAVERHRSMSVGFGHNEIQNSSSVGHDAASQALDPQDWSTGAKIINPDGSLYYEIPATVSQDNYIEYADDLAHETLTYDSVLNDSTWISLFGSAVTLTANELENLPGSVIAPKKFTKVIKPNTPENIKYPYRLGVTIANLFTVKNPPEYIFSDLYSLRKQYMHTADSYSYVASGSQPFGSLEGTIAFMDGRGTTVHPDVNARIQSVRDFFGTRVMYAYARTALDYTQAQEVQVNLYKLLNL